MKIKTIVVCCLAGLFILSLNYAYSDAKSNTSSERIGALSIRKIFEKSEKNLEIKEKLEAEQGKAIAELDKAQAEIEAEKAGLKTLKTGTTEYLAQYKILLSKQADFQAQQEFQKQQIALAERQYIESFYKDILKAAREIAEQKGLEMVLEASEPEFTDISAEGLVMTIRTNKLLYSGGCLDITDEVIARIDTAK